MPCGLAHSRTYAVKALVDDVIECDSTYGWTERERERDPPNAWMNNKRRPCGMGLATQRLCGTGGGGGRPSAR